MASPRHARARAVRSWPQRFLVAFGALLTLSCVAAASAVGYVYWKTGQFARVDVPLDERLSKDDPINYLIIGSDSRDNVDPNDPNAGAILDKSIGGKRSDTIIVVRTDPVAGTLQMLSFPRDLYINIAGQEGRDRINSAYGYGRDVLIETIRQDFGIQIHNYIEIDLEGFQRLVNKVGGVPMWVEWPMRDTHSGLEIEQTGCVTFDGAQALAFARSRYFEYREKGKWKSDPSGDLGRITRQQFFVRKALHKALDMNVATDLFAFNSLLDVATQSITIDQTIDRGDMKQLVDRFKEMNPEEIESYSLTTKSHTTSGGASVLLADDDPQNRRTLNLFRGLPPDAVSEGDVTVDVRNGTQIDGQAKDVLAALGAVGFVTGDTGDAQAPASTTIRYAPGSENAADLLRRHITSPVVLEPDESLEADHLVLVTGAGFTTVMEQARPATTTTTTTTTTEPSTSSTAPDSTSEPNATTTTESEGVGVAPGEPPPGESC